MKGYNITPEKLRKKLIHWYLKNGRDFPWRHTYDPYKIMIAEFMLHRTRAEQIVPVYNNFIEKYPDVFTLAEAKENDIKKFTLTLGLHWRSRHFIEASDFIVSKLNGIFPEDYIELRQIPGIGEYISCAISIMSFNKQAPVVDSNIARFYNRFYNLGLKGELRRKQVILEQSKEFFDAGNCRNLLFAIIDFCYFICKPRYPLCHLCFLHELCKWQDKKLF